MRFADKEAQDNARMAEISKEVGLDDALRNIGVGNGSGSSPPAEKDKAAREIETVGGY
jgi:hypothetical protein